MDLNVKGKSVAILGTGPTVNMYDWPDDHVKWSFGSAFNIFGNRVDRYFSMHHFQERIGENGIDLKNYPIIEVIKHFNTRFFTNSVAYMIAVAIIGGAENIYLFGVDMETGSEYEFEKPCVAYWIAKAEDAGINVFISSGFCDPIFLYGYEQDKIDRIKKLTETKVRFYEKCKNGYEKQGDFVTAAGLHGKKRGYEIMLSEILGE